MELQPGPPFSHSTRGLPWGLLWASTNLWRCSCECPVPADALPSPGAIPRTSSAGICPARRRGSPRSGGRRAALTARAGKSPHGPGGRPSSTPAAAATTATPAPSAVGGRDGQGRPPGTAAAAPRERPGLAAPARPRTRGWPPARPSRLPCRRSRSLHPIARSRPGAPPAPLTAAAPGAALAGGGHGGHMTRAHMTCGAHVRGAGPSDGQSAPRGQLAPPRPRPRTWERPRTGTGAAGGGGTPTEPPHPIGGSRRGVRCAGGHYRAPLVTGYSWVRGTAGYGRYSWVPPATAG